MTDNMGKPELKQFGDMVREDFDRHPVWVACNSVDYDQDWFDETDEETFRPWTDPLPADLPNGMLLVRATFEFADGSRHSGFVTPSSDVADLGVQQPYLFAGDQCFSFWGGIVGIAPEERQSLYSAFGKESGGVFPIRFSADPALATGHASGQIDGFYRSLGDKIEIEL